MMSDSLIEIFKNGDLDFIDFVDRLLDDGYVLDSYLCISRVIYNSFKDKEFQMFLRGIYPQKIGMIRLQSIGTSYGNYAFYNSLIVSPEEVLEILKVEDIETLNGF